MAKRKRLTPVSVTPTSGAETPLETKASPGFGYNAAPIADVAGSAATMAALEELAHEMETARAHGRLVIHAALDAIDENHLVRDRVSLNVEEMEVLKASLKERGQQTPIEVVSLEQGRLGLISGWRRLTALKALAAENPAGDFGHVQCLIRAPDTASDAYVAMVEENEIRTGLSFYERARIAARAAEQGAFVSPRAAAKVLFGSVARAKRSKIYSFLEIYAHLDDVLKFPSALSEKLGLQIAKALSEDAGRAVSLKAGLSAARVETAQDEVAVLTKLLQPEQGVKPGPFTEVAQGITMHVGRNKITVSGRGVTGDLEAKMRQWLSEQPS